MSEATVENTEKERKGHRGRSVNKTPGMVFTPKYKKESPGVFSLIIPVNDQNGNRIDYHFRIHGGEDSKPVIELVS